MRFVMDLSIIYIKFTLQIFTLKERYIKQGKRKSKSKKKNDCEAQGTNDTISNDSTKTEDVGGGHKRVLVSAIQVVLVEGESNEVRDVENRAYRLEAERLFNIGINMTSNVERISMVERLLDMEGLEKLT
ncbi:hypothetical protein P8452_72080 [Trifolium repens]|jgi:hypothetical protein|nr:hypothetical protein P8452_72080 [Trifolium repens]